MSDRAGDDPFITQAEVAELCDVWRGTPNQWANRHDDYPPIVKVYGVTELRSRAEVLAWLERTGRLPGRQPGQKVARQLGRKSQRKRGAGEGGN